MRIAHLAPGPLSRVGEGSTLSLFLSAVVGLRNHKSQPSLTPRLVLTPDPRILQLRLDEVPDRIADQACHRRSADEDLRQDL